MTHPLPDKAVEAGARALVRHHAWSSFWSYDDARQLVQTAVTAALAAEGLVVVPRRELTVVVGIADRNVTAPAIDTLRAMIEAAQPATEPREE